MNDEKMVEFELTSLAERSYKLTWYERFWYRGVLRIKDVVRDFPREVKWFFQRGRRGWADCDTWSLDGYMISWLPEALRHLAKNSRGCPPDLYDDKATGEDQCHKWIAVLEEMAAGFELMRKWEEDYPAVVGVKTENVKVVGSDPYYYSFKDPEWVAKYYAKQKEVYEKFEKSQQLLMKYWGNLWD
jgi:hypothetical protein